MPFGNSEPNSPTTSPPRYGGYEVTGTVRGRRQELLVAN